MHSNTFVLLASAVFDSGSVGQGKETGMCNKQHDGDSYVIDQTYLQEGKVSFNTILQPLRYYCGKSPDIEAYRLLMEMRSFFTQRFEYEQQVMLKTNNSDLQIHQLQHKLFIDHLDWAIEMIKQGKKISETLCNFLTEWFDLHTEILDKNLCTKEANAPC